MKRHKIMEKKKRKDKEVIIVALILWCVPIILVGGPLFFGFYSIFTSEGPIDDQATKYYSDDSNYVTLYGTIKEEKYHPTFDQLVIEIELSEENELFPKNEETGFNTFVLVNWTEQDFSLEVNDSITFISAPKSFGKGHRLPIMSISNNGEELLTLEEGKANYLSWLEKSFSYI